MKSDEENPSYEGILVAKSSAISVTRNSRGVSGTLSAQSDRKPNQFPKGSFDCVDVSYDPVLNVEFKMGATGCKSVGDDVTDEDEYDQEDEDRHASREPEGSERVG